MIEPKGKIYVISEKIDMRKSIDALSIMLSAQYGKNPTDGNGYVFLNRGGDKVKILYFDKNGFVLHYKRLEACRVKIESNRDEMWEISHIELLGLLVGLELKNLKIPKERNYEIF